MKGVGKKAVPALVAVLLSASALAGCAQKYIPPEIDYDDAAPAVLVGLGGVTAVAILGALVWALDSSRRGPPPATELYSTDNRATADGLAGLPKDYADVPKLGPALPGDLGRPILRAQEEGRPVIPPNVQAPRADPEEQRRLAEIEAARVARVFTESQGVRTVESPAVRADAVGSDPAAGSVFPSEPSRPDPGAAQNMQDRKLAFVNAATNRRTVSPDHVQEKASPYIAQAGTVIPAALITGIRSDLPGQVTAQVTSHVYDSPTGTHLLIPQGTRLIGRYDSQVAFGQSRVLLVWTRLVMPDGSSIVLERLQVIEAAKREAVREVSLTAAYTQDLLIALRM